MRFEFSRLPMMLVVLFAVATSRTALGGDAEKGKILFQERACAKCHATSPGAPTKPGPNLFEVAKKRERAWLKKLIKNPSDMKDDPIVQSEKKKYPLGMPASGLGDSDIDDILAYIDSADARKEGK